MPNGDYICARNGSDNLVKLYWCCVVAARVIPVSVKFSRIG